MKTNVSGRRVRARRSRRPSRFGVCRACLCQEFTPCPEGCSWVDESYTLCSACEIFADPRFTREKVVALLRAAGVLCEPRVTRHNVAVAIQRFSEIASDLLAAGYVLTPTDGQPKLKVTPFGGATHQLVASSRRAR